MIDGDGLPNGWVRVRLAEIATLRLGKMLDATRRDRGTQLPYLRNINVRWHGFDLSDLSEMGFEDDEFDEYGLLPGDVLICEGGEPGRASVWQQAGSNIKFQKAVHRVRLKGGILPQWLVLQLKHDADNGSLETHFSGTTIKHFTGVALRQFSVSLPPLAEQRRIVAKIEELTTRSRAARAALAEVPTLLEQFRRSVLASAFRGDLTAAWREKHPDAEPASVLLDRIRDERRKQWRARFPKKTYVEPASVDDSDLPDLPEGWCWATVDELAEVQLGQRRAPEYIGKEEYPYIRSANITWEGLDLADVKRMGFDDAEPLVLRRGDILLNEASGSPTEVGKPALWEDEIANCCIQATVIRLRGHSTEISPLWLFYHCLRDALLAEYAAKCPGLGIIHLTAKLLRLWPVALAPLEEQAEITRRLEVAERQRRSTTSAVTQALRDSESLDQSILAKAFRGELVPQDPADEPAATLLARIRTGGSATTPTTPTRSANRGQVKFYILLLLRTWSKPLGREMLERGLVLMLNADVRRAILGRSKPATRPTKKRGTPPQFVSGMDALLGEMIDDGQLVPGPEAGFFAEGQHGIDFTAAPPSDLDAVRETAEAMKVLHKDKQQATDADIVSALNGEIYELVS